MVTWLVGDGWQHFRGAGGAGISVFVDHMVNNHCLTKREAEPEGNAAYIVQTAKMRAGKYCMHSVSLMLHSYCIYTHAVVSVSAISQ